MPISQRLRYFSSDRIPCYGIFQYGHLAVLFPLEGLPEFRPAGGVGLVDLRILYCPQGHVEVNAEGQDHEPQEHHYESRRPPFEGLFPEGVEYVHCRDGSHDYQCAEMIAYGKGHEIPGEEQLSSRGLSSQASFQPDIEGPQNQDPEQAGHGIGLSCVVVPPDGVAESCQ